MRVVAIVQARMNSSRLPGKVLMPLANKPVLAHIVERLSYCKLVGNILVATSTTWLIDGIMPPVVIIIAERFRLK